MLNRLKKYLDYKNITIAAFERSIGMANASFGKSLKSGGTIGANKLETILILYSDLNPEWLILNRGEMLRDGKSAIIGDDKAPPGDLLTEKERVIQSQLETIETQRRYINFLETQNDLLKYQVEELKPVAGQKRKAG